MKYSTKRILLSFFYLFIFSFTGFTQSENELPYSIDQSKLETNNKWERVQGVFQTENGYTLLSVNSKGSKLLYSLIFLNENLEIKRKVSLNDELGKDFEIDQILKVNSGYILSLISKEKKTHILHVAAINFDGALVGKPIQITQALDVKGLVKINYRASVSKSGEHIAVGWKEKYSDIDKNKMHCVVFDSSLKPIKRSTFENSSIDPETSTLKTISLSNELNCFMLVAQSLNRQYRRTSYFKVICWTDENITFHEVDASKGKALTSAEMLLTATNKIQIIGYCAIPEKDEGMSFVRLPIVEVFSMTSNNSGESFSRDQMEINPKIEWLRLDHIIEEDDGEIVVAGQKRRFYTNGGGFRYEDIHIAKLTSDGLFTDQCIIPQQKTNSKDNIQYTLIPFNNQTGIFRDLGGYANKKNESKLPIYLSDDFFMPDVITFNVIDDDCNISGDLFNSSDIDNGISSFFCECGLGYSYKAVDGASLFIFNQWANFIRIEFN